MSPGATRPAGGVSPAALAAAGDGANADRGAPAARSTRIGGWGARPLPATYGRSAGFRGIEGAGPPLASPCRGPAKRGPKGYAGLATLEWLSQSCGRLRNACPGTARNNAHRAGAGKLLGLVVASLTVAEGDR